jgi:hypothetical protein
VIVGLLVLGLTLVGCSGKRTVSAHGVRVTVPPGWRGVAAEEDGNLIAPRTLLVVGTKGVRARRPSQCQPAAYRVPPTGAVVTILGWIGEPSGIGRASLQKLVRVGRTFECSKRRGAVALVGTGGSTYQVNVVVGDRASKGRITEALRIARSFQSRR